MSTRRVGRYDVIRSLGSGGMAEILLVRRTGQGGFEKRLVVKRLLPHFAADPKMVEQLAREARIGALLSHPHLVQTYDLDQDADGSPFLVLEHVEGWTLRDMAVDAWGRGRPLPLEPVVGVIAQAARALHHVHEATDGGRPLDLVHRDVSPDNVLLDDDGAVRVLDFGVARLGAATVALTEEGEIKGKIPFMAPELLEGRTADRRCDVYALGITLYWLLTGTRPFEGGSDLDGTRGHTDPVAIIRRALHDPIPPPHTVNARIPPALDDVVAAMTARSPDQRLATAAQVSERLLAAIPGAGAADARRLCRPSGERTSPPASGPPLKHACVPDGDAPTRGAGYVAPMSSRWMAAALGAVVALAAFGAAALLLDHDDDPWLLAQMSTPSAPADLPPAGPSLCSCDDDAAADAGDASPPESSGAPTGREAPKTRLVRLDADREIEWYVGDRRVGRGFGELELPLSTNAVYAWDKTLEGWIRVPIAHGEARIDHVPRGLFVYKTAGRSARVRVGTLQLTPMQPIALREGKYTLHWQEDGNDKQRSIVIRKERPFRVQLP